MNEVCLKVEGMVCEGCEARVQNVLKNIDGVEEVIANHNEKTVKIVASQSVDENILKEAIEDLGFEVIG